MTVLEHIKHRAEVRIVLWWTVTLIAWVATLYVLAANDYPVRITGQAFSQELHDSDLRGPHPAKNAVDPYANTMSRGGANCCHGKDCARFYGDPIRVKGGWKFGRWFIKDDQIIDVETLPIQERGFHHLCIGVSEDHEARTGREETPRCGYVAMGA